MPKLINTLFILTLLCACSEDTSTPDERPTPPVLDSESIIEIGSSTEESIRSLLLNYFTQIDGDYSAVNEALDNLSDAIDLLINEPTADNLESAQLSWIDAVNNYERTVLHRYLADVILSEVDALQFFQLQYQISHWPILPGYVDYMVDYPDTGIVNDMTVALDSITLRQQHGAFDVNEAVIGFHVLEFLLWGENTSTGSRSLEDFQEQLELTAQQRDDELEVAQLPNNRRRLLLTTLVEIIREDFMQLVTTWSAGSGNFREEIPSLKGGQLLLVTLDSMTNMITEELLVKSLYPMLNADYVQSLPAPFSRSSQSIVSSQLLALEKLLIENQSQDMSNLDEMLAGFSAEYAEFFLPSFDASKQCLVVLYSTDLTADPDAEFKVVECINLLTNMVDYLEQIKISLTI